MESSNEQEKHLHLAPRTSDVWFWLGIFTWSEWEILKQSFTHRNVRGMIVFPLLGKRLLLFLLEVYAAPMRSIFRFKAGRHSLGITMILICSWNILLYNTEASLHGYWVFFSKTFELLYTVIFTSTLEHLNGQELLEAFWNPHSKLLSWFFILYATCALVKLIVLKCGIKADNPWSHGKSLCFHVFGTYFSLPHSYWRLWWEASFLVIIGYGSKLYLGDVRFAIFLWISAGSLFLLELADHIQQLTYKR